jgi:hypothetical protein
VVGNFWKDEVDQAWLQVGDGIAETDSGVVYPVFRVCMKIRKRQRDGELKVEEEYAMEGEVGGSLRVLLEDYFLDTC